MRPAKAKWDAIVSESKQFTVSLRFIKALDGTGVTVNKVLSTAITKKIGEAQLYVIRRS